MIEHKPGEIFVDREGGKHRCLKLPEAIDKLSTCHERFKDSTVALTLIIKRFGTVANQVLKGDNQ